MVIDMEKELEIATQSIEKNISKINEKLLAEFPISEYINRLTSFQKTNNYNQLPADLLEKFKDISTSFGKNVLSKYHKLALCCFLKNTLSRLSTDSIPKSIKDIYFQWIKRVISEIRGDDDTIYDHEKDLFLKDLGVCRMKIFPAGALIVETSGISRKFFITGGFKQFFNACLFFFSKMRGFSPFYQTHMDMRWLHEFNPVGRNDCFIRISQMLKINPNIKGVFGASWYYDPFLENISPRLNYIRNVPEKNGAKLFKLGSSTSDINNSTAKSKTRKRLFEEGKYKPTGYLMIWPRKELIKWAASKSLSK